MTNGWSGSSHPFEACGLASFTITRLERLLKLSAALLNTERPLPASEIRSKVQGYRGSLANFRRMFERDKADLKKVGIPIIVRTVPGSDPPVDGYLVNKKDYSFNDPGFTESERAALYLAARSVRLENTNPESAVWPLGGHSLAAAEPVVSALPLEAHLVRLYEAVTSRRTASFSYRGEARLAEPLRLSFSRGHWYLAAFDRRREGIRHFRMDRIDDLELGEPGGFEPRPLSGKGPDAPTWELGSELTDVRLAVGEEIADWVLGQVEPLRTGRADDGTLLLDLRVANHDRFLDFVLSLLDHCELLEPPELRDKLLDRLRALSQASGPTPVERGLEGGAWMVEGRAKIAAGGVEGVLAGREDALKRPKRSARLDQLGRLQRMLQLVPWVTERGGAPLPEIAHRFDYPEAMLLNDLQSILFMVGVPPYTPDVLIEVSIDEDGWVNIAYADYFSKPLHLTPEQALALLAAGSAWQALERNSALSSGLEKLARLLDINAEEAIDVQLGRGEAHLELISAACKQHRKLALEYYSYNRDAFAERVVHPLRLFAEGGSWYLRGYCELACDLRTFRLDRIIRAEPGSEHFDPPSTPTDPMIWGELPADSWADLRLRPGAFWVLDYYPTIRRESASDACTARFYVSALPWLERLLLLLGPEVEVLGGCGIPEQPAAEAAIRILSIYGE